MFGLRLVDVAVFVSVVEHGSFADGGRASGVSRSTAGKAVARLEQRLGARLLHRTTRRVGLTHEGQVFHRHALELLATAEAAAHSLGADAGVPSGTLRLALPDAVGRHLVLPVVARFLKRHPLVSAELAFGDRVVDMVGEGLDLAVRIAASDPGDGLIARRLCSREVVMCAAPDYLQQQGTPQRTSDLASHHGLFFQGPAGRMPWRLPAGGEWVRPALKSRLRMDSAEAILAAAIAGLGVALLPDFLVAEALDSGALHRVLPQLQMPTVDLIGLYPQRRSMEPRVRAFLDALIVELAERPSA